MIIENKINYIGLENLPLDVQQRVRDGMADETIVEKGKSITVGGEVYTVQDRTILLFEASENNPQRHTLHGAIFQGSTTNIVSVDAQTAGAAKYAFGLIYNVAGLKERYAPKIEKKEKPMLINEVD